MADHPRSRGVYQSALNDLASATGSSPLARGLRRHDTAVRPHRGIIPARAGFTRGVTTPTRSARDHPRSRGVYARVGEGPGRQLGSSPLARGLLPRPGRRHHGTGIIPARAGFTRPAPRACRRHWDHPRSRGVYATLPQGVQTGNGSSPLARGLPTEHRKETQWLRIIPVRAGFTQRRPCSYQTTLDHPRSRGVYRRSTTVTVPCPWIIPARAGFTWITDPLVWAPVDHPRSRGVYADGEPWDSSVMGSSPLARGLPGP